MILFGAINIVAFAPLESPEKPLDSDQKKQYSCISIVILVGLVAAAVLASLLNLHGLESVAAVSLVPEGILLASGRMQARQAKDSRNNSIFLQFCRNHPQFCMNG